MPSDEFIIDNVRAMQPGEGVVADWLRVCDGQIAELGTADTPAADAADRIDGGGRLLTPGLIDVHTHAVGHSRYEAGPQEILDGAKVLGHFGTTCVLPTVSRDLNRQSLDRLRSLADSLDRAQGVCMPGFHLEGPFLALPGAGCDTVPGDVELLDELIAATGDRVVAVSISPETPNVLPVIERLCRLGIVPFITHTRAGPELTQAAIDAGAHHATHFYDVFHVPEEIDPGVRPVGAVEAILADPRCTVDFISDGVHVHPTAIKAMLAAKGYSGMILITDSNVGAGLPEGVYQTSLDYPVKVTLANAARIHDPNHPLNGVLAGSALTMDRGMDNLLDWLDLPEEQIWAMGTANPARLLGLDDKGTIRQGADADLVLWDRVDGQLRALRTWVGGQCVFDGDQ